MAEFDDLDEVVPASEIQRFFQGRSVFVTGATGFMGQVLVEKLLRSCSDLDKLYLLIRPKKNKKVEERLQEVFDGPLFEPLKRTRPGYLAQIVLIPGDISLPDLGISSQDKHTLLRDVSVVFHIAATVRFDEDLRSAFQMNVVATRIIVQLARQMAKLKALVHMSTAYANCPEKFIKEEYYPAGLDPDKLEEICACLNDDQLALLTPSLLGKWPNTYAFTKSIAENLLQREAQDLPLAIVRPSIVVSTAYEPIVGWINNLYGAIGVTVGAATGVLKTLHCNADILADIVPVDMAINCAIAAAKNVALEDSDGARIGPIFNYVSSEQRPITWGEYMAYAEQGLEWPPYNGIWYYYFHLHPHYFVHILYVIFWHWGFALVADLAATLVGKEPRLWKLYKKVHKFTNVIAYFSTQQWRFVDQNVQALWKSLSPADQRVFRFDMSRLEWKNAMLMNMKGLRVYIVKESFDKDTLTRTRKRFQRLRILHYCVIGLLYAASTYIIYMLFRLFF